MFMILNFHPRSVERKGCEGMPRYHWSFEERDEYDKGRQDEQYCRRDYDHDRYSDNDKDRAYFEGAIYDAEGTNQKGR